MSANKKTASRILPRILAIVIVATAIILGVFYHHFLRENPLSEEAMISADVVHISAAVPGTIIELAIRDGSRVSKGDVLFRLDPYTYQLHLEQARAELLIAKAGLSTNQRHIQAETSNADIAAQQVARARQNLEMMSKTVRRLRPLAEQGYASKQELDNAVTLERDAQVSLTQALSQANAATALIGESDAATAMVTVAEKAVALAEKALQDTVVRAPSDGLVVGLNVSVGERLLPDQSLFVLINSEHWYATAFYRETDLPAIDLNTCAVVYTMIDPSTKIEARVDNIGWGVTDTEMINIPRSLPYVQKSLNWVRVAQRFPVRVKLQEPPAELMRVGASATVVVRPKAECQQ